ncbi:MAG: hypothetical protein ACTTGJ_01875 [Clostridium sp.]
MSNKVGVIGSNNCKNDLLMYLINEKGVQDLVLFGYQDFEHNSISFLKLDDSLLSNDIDTALSYLRHCKQIYLIAGEYPLEIICKIIEFANTNDDIHSFILNKVRYNNNEYVMISK